MYCKIILFSCTLTLLACQLSTNVEGVTLPEAPKQKLKEKEYLKEIEYSNLLDTASQELFRTVYVKAGISSINLEEFLEQVRGFNEIIGEVGLVKEGFATSDDLTPNYDIAKLSERWQATFPIFPGYNCRISTYGLMKDFVKVQNPQLANSDNLFIDKDALKTNPKTLFDDKETEEFLALFSKIETGSFTDVEKHADVVKQDWNKKGISFPYKDTPQKASFIFVFFHSAFNENDVHLFIGHAGVLAPSSDGKLFFIEKLAYEEPYQLLRFDDRTALNDYLMNRYDVEWGQANAKPFIFENNEMLSTYRPNPNNNEQSRKDANH